MSNQNITIIDYGLGNLASVANALRKLDIQFDISADPAEIKAAKALILPGVGAAGQGMQNLHDRGLDVAIQTAVQAGTPILGICLGMQLLLSISEEGNAACLGLMPGTVKKFQTNLKVPQMGWNNVKSSSDSRLLRGLPNDSYFYFVHSYYCEPDEAEAVAGTTTYDTSFCSVLERGNIFGVQFHPEKSGNAGMQLLSNFWEAVC